MKKNVRQEKGITLIALIITIVVLLILAVVTIQAISGNSIINHAENARDKYRIGQNTENSQLSDYEGYLDTEAAKANGGTSSGASIAWTKTSTGDLAVGSPVKHIATNEEFYVIGFTGTNNDTVKLLAKYCLGTDGKQGTTAICAFSAAGGFTSGENLNNNATLKADTTSAVYKAYQYGHQILGLETGRLMTIDEITSEDLGGSLSSHSTSASPAFINTQNYWLGSAGGSDGVWIVLGEGSYLDGDDYGGGYGVRPVVEVSLSSIQ